MNEACIGLSLCLLLSLLRFNIVVLVWELKSKRKQEDCCHV
jgi:hypothetical protein